MQVSEDPVEAVELEPQLLEEGHGQKLYMLLIYVLDLFIKGGSINYLGEVP